MDNIHSLLNRSCCFQQKKEIVLFFTAFRAPSPSSGLVCFTFIHRIHGEMVPNTEKVNCKFEHGTPVSSFIHFVLSSFFPV